MIDELASAHGSPFMEQRYESNRRHSEFRVCRAPSTGLGHNDDLQRDPEGKENHPTEDPQRLRIARLATIIANTTTTMERPIKTPATKLTASRNA